MAMTRYSLVDKGGGGNFTTISAALTFAATQTLTTTPDGNWIIEVGPGNFTEDLNIPSGVRLRGQGSFATQLTGNIVTHPATTIERMRILPQNTKQFAIQVSMDVANNSVWIMDCYVATTYANLGASSIIELGGSSQGGVVYMRNCYFYNNHTFTGDNSSNAAKCVLFRVKSDFATNAEVWACKLKTSTGDPGTAWPIAVWVEQAGGTTGTYGYVEIVSSSWACFHSYFKQPMWLLSVNTGHPGIMLLAGSWTENTVPQPGFSSAYAGVPSPGINPPGSLCFNHSFEKLIVQNGISRLYGGVEYPINPSQVSAAPPTGTAPDGTITLVI